MLGYTVLTKELLFWEASYSVLPLHTGLDVVIYIVILSMSAGDLVSSLISSEITSAVCLSPIHFRLLMLFFTIVLEIEEETKNVIQKLMNSSFSTIRTSFSVYLHFVA